jgi:glycine cleavage system transcriptional repressor
MRRYFILTAIGRDRTGIVADLAEMVFEIGCNLEDSSMMNLGSEFTIMLLMSGQGDDVADRVRTACKRLEYEKEMTIFIKPIESAVAPPSPPVGKAMRLRTMGEDKAGIVARTARAVSSAGGNIHQLTSHLRPAAATGTLLYEMDMSFELPAAADVEALRRRLGDIENELHIDITLTPV